MFKLKLLTDGTGTTGTALLRLPVAKAQTGLIRVLQMQADSRDILPLWRLQDRQQQHALLKAMKRHVETQKQRTQGK